MSVEKFVVQGPESRRDGMDLSVISDQFLNRINHIRHIRALGKHSAWSKGIRAEGPTEFTARGEAPGIRGG